MNNKFKKYSKYLLHTQYQKYGEDGAWWKHNGGTVHEIYN